MPSEAKVSLEKSEPEWGDLPFPMRPDVEEVSARVVHFLVTIWMADPSACITNPCARWESAQTAPAGVKWLVRQCFEKSGFVDCSSCLQSGLVDQWLLRLPPLSCPWLDLKIVFTHSFVCFSAVM